MLLRLSAALCILLAGRVHAQGAGSVRLTVSAGPHDIRSTYQVNGHITSKITGASLIGAASLGVGLGRRLWGDVEYRSAFGSDWTFDMVSVGLTLRAGPRIGPYFRFAIGNMAGDPMEPCPPTVDCPGPNGVRRGGIEVSLGGDYALAPHIGLGPRFWWTQTVSGLPKYRLIGLGVHVAGF